MLSCLTYAAHAEGAIPHGGGTELRLVPVVADPVGRARDSVAAPCKGLDRERGGEHLAPLGHGRGWDVGDGPTEARVRLEVGDLLLEERGEHLALTWGQVHGIQGSGRTRLDDIAGLGHALPLHGGVVHPVYVSPLHAHDVGLELGQLLLIGLGGDAVPLLVLPLSDIGVLEPPLATGQDIPRPRRTPGRPGIAVRSRPAIRRCGLALGLGYRSHPHGVETSLYVVPHQVPAVLVLGPLAPVDILGLEEFLDLSLHGGVPVVLDGVVGAAREELGHLGPLVPQTLVVGDDDPVLLLGEGSLLDVRIEMVVPPLAALLADAAWKLRSDLRPLLGPVRPDQGDDLLVLLLGPGPLEGTRLLPPPDAVELGVALHALRGGPARPNHAGHLGPVDVAHLDLLPIGRVPAAVGGGEGRSGGAAAHEGVPVVQVLGIQGIDGSPELLVLREWGGCEMKMRCKMDTRTRGVGEAGI